MNATILYANLLLDYITSVKLTCQVNSFFSSFFFQIRWCFFDASKTILILDSFDRFGSLSQPIEKYDFYTNISRLPATIPWAKFRAIPPPRYPTEIPLLACGNSL